MSKKLKIKKISDKYELKRIIDDEKFSIKEKMLFSNTQEIRSQNSLYIDKKAGEIIFDHIGWGKNLKQNSVEQGGLLIGHSYIKEVDNSIVGYVEMAIPAITAKGSMTYLEFNHDTWKIMFDKLDDLNEKSENRDLQIIGWYHTHPGRLSVFMSGTDMNTQRKMFSKSWHYAIVLNPQKQIWRAFNGRNSEECNGYILSE